MKLSSLVLLALVTSLTIAAEESWLVREDGAGPAHVGMTLAELNVALQERFSLPRNKDERGCFYVSPKKQPKVAFMMLDGRLGRIDVSKSGIATIAGIQVGDSERKAREVYGKRLRIEPHHYIDNGHYLTVRSSDGRYGIRFETENGKITSFYAGRYEAIQYVEGCL